MRGSISSLRRFFSFFNVYAFFENNDAFINQSVVALFIGVTIYDSPSKTVGTGIEA